MAALERRSLSVFGQACYPQGHPWGLMWRGSEKIQSARAIGNRQRGSGLQRQLIEPWRGRVAVLGATLELAGTEARPMDCPLGLKSMLSVRLILRRFFEERLKSLTYNKAWRI